MDKQTKEDLELLMLISQALGIGLRRNFFTLQNYSAILKDVNDKIKELQ